MKKIIVLHLFFYAAFTGMAETIFVKNAEELSKANTAAKPGDTIILRNGYWNNVTMTLNCTGTKENLVTFKAETAGKVMIAGHSKLKIGGTYIVVDGLFFTNGFAGKDAVITFRTGKSEIANNCRVTNTVINDFNNPLRLQENYWVALYGKNNRLDHCSFINKKNIGVLLAVVLDDERSRENFHSIDSNYFGVRLPLASNGGEIIMVGVSEHCQFNSNTQITDNFFEYCDGETEIVSIKSCSNLIRNNVFKECQGSVVLRHGNYNTVESNVFLGNGKKGTGGVRIINKGQWVVNNFFNKCRGEGFRSPLSIMNGVPNSPANRYLEVSEALICNNSFYECSPMGFCVGSDTERSVQPYNVTFINNLFYNTKDKQLYNAYDDIKGISFAGNLADKTITQQMTNGFVRTSLTAKKISNIVIPGAGVNAANTIPDSLQSLSGNRLTSSLSSKQGIPDITQLQRTIKNALGCGAKWFNLTSSIKNQVAVNCQTAASVLLQLEKNKDAQLTINLTGTAYHFNSPLHMNGHVTITSPVKQSIQFSGTDLPFFIQLKAGNNLSLKNLRLDLSAVMANTFITTDTSGSSNHSNFSMFNCSITNCNSVFFTAAKSSVADSIIVNNCSFSNGNGNIFKLAEETDKKGYYNAEQLKITNSSFTNQKGQLLTMLRSGNDESTMGPLFTFTGNRLTNCSTGDGIAFIHLNGVQYSAIEKNVFFGCNKDKVLIQYEDVVRALHFLRNNNLSESGRMLTNKFIQADE